MTTRTKVRFIAQREYITNTLADPIMVWDDIADCEAPAPCEAAITSRKAKMAVTPNKFETGRYRVIRRETAVTETVID